MSGRAGRRGKDDRGIVIQILDEQMEPDVAKNMIYGASDPLFRCGIHGYEWCCIVLECFHFYLSVNAPHPPHQNGNLTPL